jgi:CheY-like chemotaxis protein
MKALIVEDDPISQVVLEGVMIDWGYDVAIARNGIEALEILESQEAPLLAIIDWMMPGIGGLEVCRRVRDTLTPRHYIILLTARGEKAHIVRGLESGANDYVTKPFDEEELRARVGVGALMIRLQTELACRVRELEEALSQVKTLYDMLPICSYCKNIRDDKNYWHQVESYISKHSEAVFSHRVCPSCFEKILAPQLEKLESGIRTPMNGIIGMLDLLDHTTLDPRQHEFITMAHISAQSLLRLLNDILDFSKIEAGKLELERAPFDLREGISELIKPFSLRAEEKGWR